MRTIQAMHYRDAAAVCKACHDAATEIPVGVSVAILDGSGRTLLIARFDGAAFQTPEVAQGKALTAVMMRKPSKVIEDATLNRLTLATFHDGRLPIQGGLPLIVDGECVGSVGVSGGSPDQDEQVAQAGVDAFNRLVDQN